MKYAVLAQHERDDTPSVIGPFPSEADAKSFVNSQGADGYDYTILAMIDPDEVQL